jgi:hypothetical protein
MFGRIPGRFENISFERSTPGIVAIGNARKAETRVSELRHMA